MRFKRSSQSTDLLFAPSTAILSIPELAPPPPSNKHRFEQEPWLSYRPKFKIRDAGIRAPLSVFCG